MTNDEKQALLGYLEFSLLTYVEGLEEHLIPDAVGCAYDRAYKILVDIEHTLDVQQELDDIQTQ